MKDKERKKEGFMGQKMVVIPQNIRNDMQDNPIINALYITDIGYYPRANHHYRKRMQGAKEYILIYCLEGHGWISINKKQKELSPNSYFIIPADTAHRYGANTEDPWSIYWVHFTGRSASVHFDRYCMAGPSGEKPEVIHIPFEERRLKYFDGIIALLESGYSNRIIEYINISLNQLLASFVYYDFFSEIKHPNNSEGIANSAIQYMKENLDKSITVQELADHLNYSSSYIYSLFKEKTGHSPIHYFNHLKIQKACQYLNFTDLSIKEISFELGFNDPFYFSRLFKKLMGASPTTYRKRYEN